MVVLAEPLVRLGAALVFVVLDRLAPIFGFDVRRVAAGSVLRLREVVMPLRARDAVLLEDLGFIIFGETREEKCRSQSGLNPLEKCVWWILPPTLLHTFHTSPISVMHA